MSLLPIVSIPFKREGISKAEKYDEHMETVIEFQFPSNGKAYPKINQAIRTYKLLKFQFPSNGKAYPKATYGTDKTPVTDVSIPFKREGISKGFTQLYQKPLPAMRFNSLQTGRHIQSGRRPRNGERVVICFNSLQTGRHIQSGQADIKVGGFHAESFNSLQTGRHIQSHAESHHWSTV